MGGMVFDYTQDKGNLNKSPEYEKPYGESLPALRAQGALSYLEFIDVLTELWTDSHPEIRLLPYSAFERYDPEKGYVIYSLEKKVSMSDTPRMKMHTIEDHPTDVTKKVVVFRQSFQIVINFTAMHSNPRTAEEIIEAFEDFMMPVSHVFLRLGLQSITYHGRTRDQHESRTGQDLESRNSMYSLVVQKVEPIEIDKLDELVVQVQTLFNYEQSTPNTTGVGTILVDHFTQS
jgi:hypothetical protein